MGHGRLEHRVERPKPWSGPGARHAGVHKPWLEEEQGVVTGKLYCVGAWKMAVENDGVVRWAPSPGERKRGCWTNSWLEAGISNGEEESIVVL